MFRESGARNLGFPRDRRRRRLTNPMTRDNQLTTFPPGLILAPSLTHLHIARNALTRLSWSDPVRPNPSVLKTRLENSFFDAFPSTPTKSAFRNDDDDDALMPSLRVLDLSGNRITNAGLPREWPRAVEVVDLSNNALEGCLDLTSFATLPRLRRLVLRGNAITGVRVNEREEPCWAVLESVDLEGNDLVAEEEVVRALKMGRKWTTGGPATEGAVQIVSFGPGESGNSCARSRLTVRRRNSTGIRSCARSSSRRIPRPLSSGRTRNTRSSNPRRPNHQYSNSL